MWHSMTLEFEGRMKVATENEIQCRDKLPRLGYMGMECSTRSMGELYDPF